MVLFSETSDFLRCFANSIGVMYFHLWIVFFDINIYIHIAPLASWSEWLANFISSSISIGSVNKHQLTEMLLTACNYYQLYLKTCSKIFHMSKNVASMHVKHLLNVKNLWIIWSSFLFLTLNKLLGKLVLVIKSLFYLLWLWCITLSYKLQEVTS